MVAWSLDVLIGQLINQNIQRSCYYAREVNNYHPEFRTMYYCWSRHDNNDDDLKNLTISAAAYDDSELNAIINRPFTARFYVNETHVTCHDNEKW